jgi:NitT/TauT family transport system substrate-binding protein
VKKQLTMILMITVTLLIAACGNNEATPEKENAAAKVEQIKMASWSKPIVEQSNLYLAEEKGWFEEAGIDFEYVPGAGGGDAVKNIIAGNADIAFANVEAVLLAAEKGENLKVIYNIYPENVFNVVSLKENAIESVEDLKGKDIGVYSFTSGTYQNLQVLLTSAGMTEEDVNVIETGVLNFGPLMNNQVEATAATDTGLYDAKQKGLGDVNVFEVKDVLNTPSDVFVVTEDTFNEKRDALVKFLQVYRDSAKYMMDHPEEAAKAAVDTAIDGQNEVRNVEIIKIRNATAINEEMKEKGLGWLNVDILKEVEETYVDMGLLEGSVGIEEIVTNELVKELN